MHGATLSNNVAGVCDRLDGLAASSLAILDVVGLLLGSQEAELAVDNDQVVGRGGTVESTLGAGSNINVVHVQATWENNADPRHIIDGKYAAGKESARLPNTSSMRF